MIPQRVQDKHIDLGVFGLVKNLNRVPGVFTYTTCEGHVYGEECPLMPTKSGWVHVHIPDEHKTLLGAINDYVATNPFFELVFWDSWDPHHTIDACFDDDTCEVDLDQLSPTKKVDYLAKSQARLKEHFKGWKDMEDIVADYIQLELGFYPGQLPYRDVESKDVAAMGLGRCAFH